MSEIWTSLLQSSIWHFRFAYSTYSSPLSDGEKKKVKVIVTQSCPTVCDPMDYSLPGPSVHGILQARILEWVTFPFCRVSSQSRHQTQVSRIAGRFFTIWAPREAQVTVGVLASQSKEITKLWAVKHDLVTEQQLAVLFELQIRIFFLTYLS